MRCGSAEAHWRGKTRKHLTNVRRSAGRYAHARKAHEFRAADGRREQSNEAEGVTESPASSGWMTERSFVVAQPERYGPVFGSRAGERPI